MSSRKTVILIAAIGFGVLAAFVLWQYTSGLEDDVYADSERIPVWVASRDIPANTPGDAAIAAFLEEKLVPREFVPASVITSTEVLQGKVALGEIKANEFILEGNFVNPSLAQTSFTQRIPDGLVAVPLTLSAEQTGGFLQPGDSVLLVVQQDIDVAAFAAERCLEFGATTEERELAYAQYSLAATSGQPLACASSLVVGSGPDAAAPAGDGIVLDGASDASESTIPATAYNTVARPFFWEAQVLAIGVQTALAPGEAVISEEEGEPATITTGSVTFAVPPEAMLRLLALDSSKLKVIMVPDNFEPKVLQQLTVEDLTDPLALFPAEILDVLTPYGPDGYIAGDPALGDIAFSDEETTNQGTRPDEPTPSTTVGGN